MLQRLKALFRPSPAAQVRILYRDPLRLTVDEWRTSGELISVARRVLADPGVRQMLDALRNSHFARYVALGSMEERACHLSKCEGYTAALNDFEAMAIPELPKEPLEEPTFEDPDLTQETA